MKSRKAIVSLLTCLFLLLNFLAMPLTVLAQEDDIIRYLSDIPELSASVGYGSFMKDRGQEGMTLRLLDDNLTPVTYEKGLMAHAASEVIYDIDGIGAKRFQAYAGINYNKAGSCGFYVYADDTPLFENPLIRQNQPQVRIDVEIPEGTKQLRLVTDDGGNGITADHSTWADAKLVLDAARQNQLHRITLSAPETVLEVGEATALSVAGRLVSGLPADMSGASFTFTSSDTAIATVNEDGTVTALARGNSTIECVATLDGASASGSLTFAVVEDKDTAKWSLQSPDQSKSIGLYLQGDGSLYYYAKSGEETIVDNSPTGIKTNLGDFTKGLLFDSKQERVIDETYELIGAKVSQAHNYANELTLNFVQSGIGGKTFQVIARAYNDGVAFRYGVISEEGQALTIQSENTGIQLPQDSTIWAMPYINHHEEVAVQKSITSLQGQRYIMPMLYQTPGGTWALISEAALSAQYCGADLYGAEDGLVNVVFSAEQTGDVQTTAPFVSPWRFIVMGSTADINTNVMAENLSPECALDDTSWIEPGVTAWTWLNRESTSSYATYVRYVDMAAEMGWQYLLLDEGWQPKAPSGSGLVYGGYYSWTEDLIQYANEKGVGLLVWANHNDLLNVSYREQLFKEWSEMGFKGVKPDFFNSQSQTYITLYEDLGKLTAENNLLLNIHGCNKTTGERRTYPHMLTREGVFGAEQDLFRPTDMSAQHNCMLPFTRNAVGPADFTPMFSYRVSGTRRYYSLAHMAAMPVVYESGIQCLADRDDIYPNSPARDFFAGIPAAWDETVMLAGEPGEYVNIARRSGETWYVGAMCNTQRDAVVDLSFLGEGEYYASIFKDGETLEQIVPEYRLVTREDTLTVPMLATGGAAIKLTKENPVPTLPDSLTLDQNELTIHQQESVTLTATIETSEEVKPVVVWESSEPEVASVENGKVTALKPGKATITAYVEDPFTKERVSDSCTVTVLYPAYRLTTDWEILYEDMTHWNVGAENEVTIVSQPGEFYTDTTTVDRVARNVFLTPGQGDFEAVVKLDFAPEADYQSAGLIVYAGDRQNFTVLRRSHSSFNPDGWTFSANSLNGTSFNEKTKIDTNDPGPVYLRVTRSGTSFSGYYRFSTDDEWVLIGTTTNASLSAADLRVGLYCVNGNGRSGSIPGTFTDFTLNGNIVPFANANADKTALQELYYQYKDTENNNYTEASWAAFQGALADAKTILDKVDATQEEVDTAAENLQTAYDGLTDIPEVNKEALEALYNQYKDVENDNYTAESWERFQNALTEAKTVLDRDDATQEAVDAAAQELEAAYTALEKVSVPVESVKINLGVLTNLKYGKTLELDVTVNPEEATDKTLVFTSSNENILTVDENGVVTGIKPGTARVTATAHNGVKHTVTIRVTA